MAAAAIVVVPVYVGQLGLEAFGVVALYLLLNTWIALLNFGLSTTLTREAARFRAGSVSDDDLGALLRSVERLFAGIALGLALAIGLLAPYLVEHWLQLDNLDPIEAVAGLRLVGAILGLRFLTSPYRAVLIGFEDLKWLSGFNVLITTVRTIGVIGALHFLAPTLEIFFWYLLAVGVVEAALIARRARVGLSRVRPSSMMEALSKHWRFSFGMAVSAAVWVAATTADKAIISGTVPLAEYAIFSIAVMAATGVEMVAQPVTGAFSPRLAFLRAADRLPELTDIYDKLTQLTAVLAFSSAAFLCAFSAPVLFAWTGKASIVGPAAPVLATYAVGNALLAVGANPLQLQTAEGKVGVHLIATVVFAALIIGGLMIAVPKFGIWGAAWVWLTVNALMFVVYLPIVHRLFYHQSHWRWLRRNVAPPAIASALTAFAAHSLFPVELDRIGTVVALAILGTFILTTTAFSSRVCRAQVLQFTNARKGTEPQS